MTSEFHCGTELQHCAWVTRLWKRSDEYSTNSKPLLHNLELFWHAASND
jgi:hypothetical protein